jgi:tRNA-specific 2-thiouridylase
MTGKNRVKLGFLVKVAVLVSGGVDSSVALRLLKDQGHEVTAFYLKIWLEDELTYLGDCPWEQDLAYVRAVCEQAQVPLEVISLQKEYHQEVVNYTIGEVKAGRTPNPDMLCNKHIKFGVFMRFIDGLAGACFDKIATGHYADIIEQDGVYCLRRAPDAIKDQSYFLSQLSQQQLSRILFPLGALCKDQVRDLAQKYDLPNKDRKDSQGICFLGKLKFKDFIKHYLGENPGAMIEVETGNSVGTHDGLWFYTIGQRQGLGLPGGPWYVVAKDLKRNYLYLSRNYFSEDKERNSFAIEQCNWILKPASGAVWVKMRHGPHLAQAQILVHDNSRAHITLAQRDQGIAAGQFAVIYNDAGLCLGGGVISQNI